MERRRLIVVLVAAISTICLFQAPASARQSPSPICRIQSLSSVPGHGESAIGSGIADIVEVECQPVYAGQNVTIHATGLFEHCRHELSWAQPPTLPKPPKTGPSFKVTLNAEGKATAVVWGGPFCAAGESVITADLEVAPFPAVSTAFTVLPRKPTAPGLKVLTPGGAASELESIEGMKAAALIDVVFPPAFAGRPVAINANLLSMPCALPHVPIWVGPLGLLLAEGSEVTKVRLDHEGSSIVALLLGGGVCGIGTNLIEASLEEAPYTTFAIEFTDGPA